MYGLDGRSDRLGDMRESSIEQYLSVVGKCVLEAKELVIEGLLHLLALMTRNDE